MTPSVIVHLSGFLGAQFEVVRISLTQTLQPGRELSLALTKLEEAEMWASKAEPKVTK